MSFNNNKSNSWFIDICIFALLIFLLSRVYKRGYEFLTLHKNSAVHQLDKTFTDQLYSVQRQANSIKNFFEHLPHNPKQYPQLLTIISSLTKIEEKYTKNSPAVMLLGPIGTTSIVLKEQELSSQLLTEVNNLGSLLADYTASLYTQAATISAGLQQIQELSSKITK